MDRAIVMAFLVASAGCNARSEEDGHGDHGHGHEHDDHGHASPDEPAPFSMTRWTKTHELFVELDAPVIGKSSVFHAHVTRLADNHPVADGVVQVDWLPAASRDEDPEPVESFVAFAVTRPGIFSFEAPMPEIAGTYRLRIAYQHDDEHAVWDAGTFPIGAQPSPPPDSTEGEVVFLKETQWRIPFATAPAQPRLLAESLHALALVEPAPGATRSLTSPASGHLDWGAQPAVAVGSHVEAGAVVGRIHVGAVDVHWSTLTLNLRNAEIERDRATAELRRLSALVEDGLVPARRLDEARAAQARARARINAARRQQNQAQGGAGQVIPIRVPADGVVVEVTTKDGASVHVGKPVLRIVESRAARLRVEVLPSEVRSIADVMGLEIQRFEGPPVSVPRDHIETQSLVVDPQSGLAPLVLRAPDGDWIVGSRVPVRIAVGNPVPRLAVPRSAVVEINARPYLFVMLSGESFTRRFVRLGPGSAKYVAIAEGLDAGERVVTRGGFDVYVASLTDRLESHRH